MPEERSSFAESEPAEALPEDCDSAADGAAIEDDAEFVKASARSLEFGEGSAEAANTAEVNVGAGTKTQLAGEDDLGDLQALTSGLPTGVAVGEGPQNIDPSSEVSYLRLIVELKRIESEVRRILEPKDPRRKRRFTGTRRWIELEEDIHEWRFTGRFGEPTLRELLRLIARRHMLFARLRFLAATRPTWNT